MCLEKGQRLNFTSCDLQPGFASFYRNVKKKKQMNAKEKIANKKQINAKEMC
jgi:hypothetical protein